LPWNGGREIAIDSNCSKEDLFLIQEHIQPLLDYNIKIRHTCTNSLIKDEYLNHELCNFYLKLTEQEGNSVIVASPELKEYIKMNFPKYSIINSTTLGITDINIYNQLSKTELTVLDYNYNNNNEYLKQLQHPENIEILCAEACRPNCEKRKDHYLSISRSNLYQDEPRFFCDYAGIKNFYLNLQKLPHVITNERIEEMVTMGINNFKIAGRTLGGDMMLELLLYYLIKPEYQNITRCEALYCRVAR
jgi:collagenase-like PrtC family protease